MRQYRIITKTPTVKQVILRPGMDSSQYNIPEVRDAVDYLKSQPHVEMIGIRIGAKYFSLVVVHNDELQPDHFRLDEPSNG